MLAFHHRAIIKWLQSNNTKKVIYLVIQIVLPKCACVSKVLLISFCSEASSGDVSDDGFVIAHYPLDSKLVYVQQHVPELKK